MLKPISIKIDTITKQMVTNYNNIRKGDTLILTINVYQNSTSLTITSQTIKLILRKPDGYSIEKTVTGTGNVITVTLDEQSTLAIGEVTGEIQFSDSNGVSISNWFTYEVEESLADDIITESSSSIETLQDIQNLINNYNDNADALAEQNTLALSNISSLDTKNATASSNISALSTQNTNATSNISSLESQNNEATENISDLTSLNETATITDSTLNNSITLANQAILELTNANWEVIESIFNLVNVLAGGVNVVDESGNSITDENGNEWAM